MLSKYRVGEWDRFLQSQELWPDVTLPECDFAFPALVFWSMLTIFAFLALLPSPQLDPALTPQKAAKPALPKIDENACPFEGCQFGAWTATAAVQLFSSWKEDRKPVATLSKGDGKDALSGSGRAFCNGFTSS